MIIVLTPEAPVEKEPEYVTRLLDLGIDLLHIRKFRLTDEEMVAYINGIGVKYREQLVLHSHFHLAETTGIRRLHFREADRRMHRHAGFTGSYVTSTSVHTIDDFNTLAGHWDYAFLSPVFSSISKPDYGRGRTVLHDIRLKKNPQVHLVGLGGINAHNYREVYEAGADGIAMLGAVWNDHMPDEMLSEIVAHPAKIHRNAL